MAKTIFEGNTSVSIRNSILKLITGWPVFVMFLGAAVFSAWLYFDLSTLFYQANARVQISNFNGDVVDANRQNVLPKDAENTIALLQSQKLLLAVVKSLNFSTSNPQKAVSELVRNLKVDFVNKKEDLIQIRFTDGEQKRSRAVVNALIKVFNDYSAEKNKQLAANLSVSGEQNLALIENDLAKIEQQIEADKAIQDKLKLHSANTKSDEIRKQTLFFINQKLASESKSYSLLQQKREDAQVALASNTVNLQKLNPLSVTVKQTDLRRESIYLNTAFIALILCFGVGFGNYFVSRKVAFKNEINALTSLPVIGEIVFANAKNLIAINANQKNLIATQFKKLCTTLKYLSVDAVKKRILITSSIAGEGKTFVAANLAASLALAGKKVILLDFNFQNPSLSNKLNTSLKSAGIAAYLQENAALNSIIESTFVNENLHFISAGAFIKPHLQADINRKMEQLFNYLDNLYDYILFDAAPVNPDSERLANLCDVTLYIIKHGFTPKKAVLKLDGYLKQKAIANAAVIVNNVPSTSVDNQQTYIFEHFIVDRFAALWK